MTAAVKPCPIGKRSAENCSANRGDPELGSGAGFDGSRSEFDESASHQTKSNRTLNSIEPRMAGGGRAMLCAPIVANRGKSCLRTTMACQRHGVPQLFGALPKKIFLQNEPKLILAFKELQNGDRQKRSQPEAHVALLCAAASWSAPALWALWQPCSKRKRQRAGALQDLADIRTRASALCVFVVQ